jgi:hypothetical protein
MHETGANRSARSGARLTSIRPRGDPTPFPGLTWMGGTHLRPGPVRVRRPRRCYRLLQPRQARVATGHALDLRPCDWAGCAWHRNGALAESVSWGRFHEREPDRFQNRPRDPPSADSWHRSDTGFGRRPSDRLEVGRPARVGPPGRRTPGAQSMSARSVSDSGRQLACATARPSVGLRVAAVMAARWPARPDGLRPRPRRLRPAKRGCGEGSSRVEQRLPRCASGARGGRPYPASLGPRPFSVMTLRHDR